MLTYALTKTGGVSLYEQLYRRVKDDILTGRLATGEKLPSKRALAAHLEVSVITVKNAYEQLMAEGYIYGMEKKGYYVSPVQRPLTAPAHRQEAAPPAEHVWEMDLVTNSIAAEDFPFTVWARLMRQTILEQGTGLLRPMPPQGAPELRRAIAAYLRQFRGMTVDEEQIIIGAGTEQLYNMLVQLLGRDKRYAVEDPGYGKIARIYRSNQAEVVSVPLDGAGLSVSALDEAGADVVHISPSHHYPTGIVMPIARRQELLRRMGITDFSVVVPDVEETYPEGLAPQEIVAHIARLKSDAAAPLVGPEDILITADTMVFWENDRLGKPRDEADALRMLTELAGNRHTVCTGVTVRQGGKAEAFTVSTDVYFRPCVEEELRAYIATGEPMDKAGAYGVQSLGALLVERIDGDFYNVMGLPVEKLGQCLTKHFGVRFF